MGEGTDALLSLLVVVVDNLLRTSSPRATKFDLPDSNGERLHGRMTELMHH